MSPELVQALAFLGTGLLLGSALAYLTSELRQPAQTQHELDRVGDEAIDRMETELAATLEAMIAQAETATKKGMRRG